MKRPSSQPKKQKTGKNKKSKKKKYKVRNWREYNAMLVERGSIFFWIEQSAQEDWNDTEKTGKPGAPKSYSDRTISTCLAVKAVFHLSLRATEGFVNSFFRLLCVRLSAPDYSTLCIRAGSVPVFVYTKNTDHAHSAEPLHIVVDSSGAKVYGEGEWKVRQHGWCKHRTWRKFHLCVDERTKQIRAAEVTGNDVADSEMLEPLLTKIAERIDKVSADGAYDKRRCYTFLSDSQIGAVIPPQKNARIWQHGNTKAPPHIRDENLRRIREVGIQQWKTDTGYHRRSIAENCVFRFKTIFSDRLSSRKFDNQRTEILLKCQILNKMANLGLPQAYVVG